MPRRNGKGQFKNKRRPFTEMPKTTAEDGRYSGSRSFRGYAVERDDPRRPEPYTIEGPLWANVLGSAPDGASPSPRLMRKQWES